MHSNFWKAWDRLPVDKPVFIALSGLPGSGKSYFSKKLYAIAKRVNVKFVLVKLEAPPKVIRERLETRKKDLFNRSDADWQAYLDLKQREEKIRSRYIFVDTSRDITPTINRILNEIRD